jgi:hypothetical protein
MVIVDSVVRLIPGVLGGEQSAEIESFSDRIRISQIWVKIQKNLMSLVATMLNAVGANNNRTPIKDYSVSL